MSPWSNGKAAHLKNGISRFHATPTQLLLATALWIATIPNVGTLQRFANASASGHGMGAAFFVFGGWLFVLMVTFAVLLIPAAFARGAIARGWCAAMLLLAAVVGYFSTFLGTQFDKTMVINMAQTNIPETLELIHWRLVAWVTVVGLLPATIAWRVPLVPGASRLRVATRSFAILLAMAVLTAITVYAQYSRYATAARNRDITFATVAPTNLIGSAIAQGVSEVVAKTLRAPRGTDAHQGYALPEARLLVLVLGETARAQNHGLNGYMRDTTPRMKAAGGYYFADTESCGTVTAISVPCIFSGLSRADFSLMKGRENETLIDVVKRSGARVIWLDNDSGCKDVCASAEYSDLTGSSDPRFCPEPAECHDEMLLDGLEARIAADPRDTLVVLHVKGSHGPAYYKRYPSAFERFTPVCRSSDLSACETAALVNAYDNTILYTDHVVGETIGLLQRLSGKFATALLYVSDHGESLGESGLYLHGIPYAIAPKEQTRVPMFAWVSPEFLRLERWNPECMARQTQMRRSHDNVYATVLGFMEIESVEYKPALDLFDACDPPRK